MCAVESLSMAGGGGGRWSGRKQEVEAARAENTGYCGADYHFAERVISIVLSRRGIYLDLCFIKIPLGVWSMENSMYGGLEGRKVEPCEIHEDALCGQGNGTAAWP